MDDRVSIEVLGPLRIHRAGVPVDVSAAMAQRMLALLVARGGVPIRIDALAEAMWEGSPPRTARKTLQVYAHRLRRALGGEDRIEFTAGGYRIQLSPGELDAQRFERLIAEAAQAAGDPARAASLLDDALSLWRGEAYAGIGGLQPIELERQRLEELRLSGVESRLAIGLELGDHEALLGRLRLAVAEHPFRERLRVLLMLALHRVGRRAEALELYRETHRLLAEELGVEPMAELQRLHLRVLSNDPALEWKPSPAPQRFLPHDVAGFVGRRSDLEWLDTRESEGHASAVIITAIAGAAGIGKTALAVRWAHHAAGRFPDGQFYVNLRGYDHGQPLRPFEALVHLLRLLGVKGERLPVDETAAAAMFRSLLAGRKVLLLLDNARTAEQVRPLLPGDPRCLVVVTSREKLSGLIATEGAQRLTLGLLAAHESVTLLRGIIGDDRVEGEPEAVARLADLCGRLPLALRIAAAHLADRPGEPIARYVAELARGSRFKALDLPDDEHRGLPAVFEQSYVVLPEGQQRAFRWLSLVPGPDFTVAAASALLDAPEPETLSTLEALASCHLLETHEPGRYAYHDLIGEFARFLMRDSGEPVAQPRERLLNYLRTAAAAADSAFADRRTLRGEAAESASSFDAAQAIRWLERERANLVAAVSAAAAAGLPEVASGIAQSLFMSFYYTGNTGEWIATFECAVDAVGQTDDLNAKLFLLNLLGQAYGRAGDWRKALGVQREVVQARASLGDEVGAARARCNLAMTYSRQGLFHESLAELEPALEVIHRHGEKSVEAYIRATALAATLNHLGRHAEAERHLLDSIGTLRESSDGFSVARALLGLGRTARLLIRLEESQAYLAEGLDLAVSLGDRNSESFLLLELAMTLEELGHHQASLDRARQALVMIKELGIGSSEAYCLVQIGSSYAKLGETQSSREAYESALAIAEEFDLAQPRGRALAGLGRLFGDRGKVAEALAILEPIAPGDAKPLREWLDGPST